MQGRHHLLKVSIAGRSPVENEGEVVEEPEPVEDRLQRGGCGLVGLDVRYVYFRWT